jgi:hypothetical protein
MKMLSNTSVKLCCNTKQGCPELTKVDEDFYSIKDDDGNTIKIHKDELKLVGDAVKLIDESAEKLILG